MDYIHELRQAIGPRKIILNAATTIIEKDGKILLQRRSDNGKWGLIVSDQCSTVDTLNDICIFSVQGNKSSTAA